MKYMIRRKEFKILFFATVFTVLYLALMPTVEEYQPIYQDKIKHIFAFFVLSFLLNQASSTILHRLRNMGALLLFGIFIEFVQSFTPYREASLGDVIADLIGILLFQLFFSIYRFYKHKKA